jgi:hypothetical protein
MGKPCIAGAEDIDIDVAGQKLTSNGTTVREGEWMSLDGTTGEVFAGQREDLFDPGLLTERERIWIGSKDAEKRFEKTPLARLAGSLDLAPAIGIVARGQLLPRRCIAGGIPASLVLGKVRLHLLNLRVKARALRRRRVEQKELAPVAAKRTRISDRAIEFRALFLRGAAIMVRIRLAAFAERGDPRR